MRITRRTFLAAGVAAVATMGEACIEPHRITVTHHVVGEPDAVAPLRIVQLTDMHLQKIGPLEQHVAAAVRRLDPDLVVLTGDIVDHPSGLRLLATFLPLLPRRTRKLATLGNWEHAGGTDLTELAAVYRQHGTQLLVNQGARVAHHGRTLLVTGLDDMTAGRPRTESVLHASAAGVSNHVVLQHSPGYRDVLVQQAANERGNVSLPDVMLSGHTHGGQLQVLGWAPVLPRGSGGYVSGWYRKVRPYLYVSRGLASSVVPLRLGAPPEVACFDWHLRA